MGSSLRSSLSEEILDLGPEHRAQLEEFSCASSRQPWSEEAEYAIRELLPFAIETGAAYGLGLFVDGQLCSVISWTIQGERWISATAGTVHGARRRKYAKRLKIELLNRAQDAGALSVVSYVDEDNVPMLEMNRILGAEIDREPGERRYLLCTIRLR